MVSWAHSVSAVAIHGPLSGAWTLTLGDGRICVAVLDGPVDKSHIAFRGASLTEIQSRSAAPGLSTGRASEHGTYVASIIFGQHEGPVTGIAPRCRGLLIPIFSDALDGGVATCTQADLADAVRVAVDAGAHIINISGGEFTTSGALHPSLGDVFDRCDQQGLLIVAAAGNDACDCLHIPAAHPSILAVGAATVAGHPLDWSNWGKEYQGHGLLAPGENVRGAAPGGRLSERSGTSSAAAIVSGVAGLLMSLDLQNGIKPDGRRIRQLLLQSSDPCPSMSPSVCQRYLSGVLNVNRAVALVSKKAHVMNLNESDSGRKSHFQEFEDGNRPDPGSGAYPSDRPTYVGPHAVDGSTAAGARMATVAPSACACGGQGLPQYVFALGQIGYSFSSLARAESICQHMRADHREAKRNPKPHDADIVKKDDVDPRVPEDLFWYLEHRAPWDATSVIWTLNIEHVPVYAISVAGPNSQAIVAEFMRIMRGQKAYDQEVKDAELARPDLDEDDIERVSIAGSLGGQVTLATGELLSVIHPELRGTICWNSQSLAKLVVAQFEKEPKADQKSQKAQGIKHRSKAEKEKIVERFLERMCFDFRNLGRRSDERAINFVATYPYAFKAAFERVAISESELRLHTVEVERSLVCRPGSECWDVKLEYFDPASNTDAARRVYRVAIDVSDVVPVVAGELRYWSIGE
jgi:Subtilase family/PatG C-terminal/PatG Domain